MATATSKRVLMQPHIFNQSHARRSNLAGGASHHHALLLAAASCRLFPNNALAAERLNTFTNAWIKGVDGVEYTPKGLAYSGVF